MSIKQTRRKTEIDEITNRLDALIRLLVELNKPKSQEKFTEAATARILWSSGLTPTQIAKILGKKSATDVSKYLYPKKKAIGENPSLQTEGEETKEQNGSFA